MTGRRTYDPGKRIFQLLANLVDRPRRREELYKLGYEQSGADRAKALNRDIEKLREFGYPVNQSDEEDPLFEIDRAGLIGLDLDAADLTLLRLAAQSLTGRDELHKVARRTVHKLLGGASITADQATVRIALPQIGHLFEIVDAIGKRAPIVIEYDNPRSPDRRFYLVEADGVWETFGSFYCRGTRLAMGATRDEMGDLAPEVRNFRLSRIVSVEVLEPTGYTAEPVTSRSFDPVTATIYLAPGAGEHLRNRAEYVGTDEDGWEGYRFTDVSWARLLDQLNLLGIEARTDVADYQERLSHIAGLGE